MTRELTKIEDAMENPSNPRITKRRQERFYIVKIVLKGRQVR